MASKPGLEEDQAYNWSEKGASITQHLKMGADLDDSQNAVLLEQLGYSLYRASMQSDSQNEFRDRIRQSIDAYQKAIPINQKMARKAEAFRCQAMKEYLLYWISAEIREKRVRLASAWQSTKRSLTRFRKAADNLEFGGTYNQLALVPSLLMSVGQKATVKRLILKQAIDLGEEAIKRLSSVPSPVELARSYAINSIVALGIAYYSDQTGKDELVNRSENAWRKALQTSEVSALLEMATQARVGNPELGVEGSEEIIAFLEKTLELVRTTMDKPTICSILDLLAYNVYRRISVSDDPEEREDLLGRLAVLTEESGREYSPFSGRNSLRSVYSIFSLRADSSWSLAQFETDDSKKLVRLEAALRLALEDLANSRKQGSLEAEEQANHVASKILTAIAVVERRPTQKKILLERAYRHRKKAIAVNRRIAPSHDLWNKGLHQNYLADIVASYLSLADSENAKTRILSRAIILKERCLSMCSRDSYVLNWSSGPSAFYGYLGRYQLQCGDLYVKLYDLRKKTSDLQTADQRFRAAAESFERVGQRARSAEARWKGALALEKMRQHIRASESYSLACHSYNIASQKIPSLKTFYQELCDYMQAQSEIEKAKHYHSRRRFSEAKECYAKAARLHIASKIWSYLAPYYSAWENIENAEDLAIIQRSEDAIQSFEEAVRLFQEAERSIQLQVLIITDEREKSTARDLVAEAATWAKYSKARVVVERARAAVRNGDLELCWKTCDVAIDMLQDLIPGIRIAEAKEEVSSILQLCLICRTMTRAEAEISPKMFSEAADLLESWQKLMPSPRSRMLVLGHSHLCKALELGSVYNETRTKKLYASAKRHCEAAKDCYLACESPEYSEYARGTALLFDAFFYMDTAKKELEPGKKAHLFLAAEELLATASAAYSKAGYSKKTEQTLQLLANVRKDRVVAVSITQALGGVTSLMPTLTTSGSIGPSTGPSMGPEKLATAFVIADLSASPTTPRVGDKLEIKITLSNAGHHPATLLRLEDAIPYGFELREIPESSTLEGNNIGLRRRRLGSLKSEELRLILKTVVACKATLRPRVVYLDETGRQRSHDLTPLSLTVKNAESGGTDVRAILVFKTDEYFVGEHFDCSLEISASGARSVTLEAIDNVVPEGLVLSKCEGGFFEAGPNRIDLRGLHFQPGESQIVKLVLQAKQEGKYAMAPKLKFEEDSGSGKEIAVKPVGLTVHPVSPILEFLAHEFMRDYSTKRLSIEQAGWRTLMNIASSLRIPRSQVYGETRYGHSFGRPVESLLRSGLIEYRTFPGRGRGGNITKIRVVSDRDSIRRLLAWTEPTSSLDTMVKKAEAAVHALAPSQNVFERED